MKTMFEVEDRVRATQYHADKCIEALELSDFASHGECKTLLPDIDSSFKKLAQYHAFHAYNWVEPK